MTTLVKLAGEIVRQQDTVRTSDGRAWIAIPRLSGQVRLWPYYTAKRGNPFSRRSEASEQLENLRERMARDW